MENQNNPISSSDITPPSPKKSNILKLVLSFVLLIVIGAGTVMISGGSNLLEGKIKVQKVKAEGTPLLFQASINDPTGVNLESNTIELAIDDQSKTDLLNE